MSSIDNLSKPIDTEERAEKTNKKIKLEDDKWKKMKEEKEEIKKKLEEERKKGLQEKPNTNKPQIERDQRGHIVPKEFKITDMSNTAKAKQQKKDAEGKQIREAAEEESRQRKEKKKKNFKHLCMYNQYVF